jgi:hypothetical protein
MVANSAGNNPNLNEKVVFQYRTLRMFIGLIAFGIPFVCWGAVIVVQGEWFIPSSISVTYHLGARDFFVGMLAVVGTFLLAYNGHKSPKIRILGRSHSIERYLSFTAGLCAACVALFPTSVDLPWINREKLSLVHFPTIKIENVKKLFQCAAENEPQSCNLSPVSFAPDLHITCAAVLFIVLILFCINFYWRTCKKLKGLARSVKPAELACIPKIKLRRNLYLVTGAIIVVSGAVALFLELVSENGSDVSMMIVEIGCLLGFGLSWIVSGVPWLRGNGAIEQEITASMDTEVVELSPNDAV